MANSLLGQPSAVVLNQVTIKGQVESAGEVDVETFSFSRPAYGYITMRTNYGANITFRVDDLTKVLTELGNVRVESGYNGSSYFDR